MSTEATHCEAFDCRNPTLEMTDDNGMLVRIIDRSTSMGTSLRSERVSEQVNRIHKTCFDPTVYVKA